MNLYSYNYNNLKGEGAYEFMEDAFSGTNAFFRLHGGIDRKGIYVSGENLCLTDGDKWIRYAAKEDGKKKEQKATKNGNIDTDFFERYPQNIRVSTCGYNEEGRATKDNIKVIAMICIRLDYNYKQGASKLADLEKVLSLFEKEVLENRIIPLPTYYLLDGTISLLYVFKQKVFITKQNQKERFEQIEEQARRICGVINRINPEYNAHFKKVNDEIFVPGIRHLKIEKYKNYVPTHNYIVSAKKRGPGYFLEDLLNINLPASEINGQCVQKNNQTQRFLNILMNDKRDTFIATAKFHGEITNSAPSYAFHKRSQDILVSKKDKTINYYVCLNPVRTKSVEGKDVHNYNAIFIDLDDHNSKGKQQMRNINKARIDLTVAFQNGVLPKPTMMVHTGCGLAIYYVLKRSIPANAEKAVWKFFQLWRCLNKRIQDYLNSVASVVEVDEAVVSSARLVRLPGSINQKNGKECCLLFTNHDLHGEIIYSDMDELAEETHLKDFVENQKKNRNNKCKSEEVNIEMVKSSKRKTSRNVGNHVNGGREYTKQEERNLQKRRVHNIINFLEEIDYCCYSCNALGANVTNCRDNILFLLYNCLIQIMDARTAMEKVLEVNQLFNVPMQEREARRYLRSVDKVYQNTNKGYQFNQSQFMDKLGVAGDDEMQAKIGIGKSLQLLERAESKEVNKYKQERELMRLTEAVMKNPELTNKQMAKMLGKSLSWVEKNRKKIGICKKQMKEGNGQETFSRVVKKRKIIVAEFLEYDKNRKIA